MELREVREAGRKGGNVEGAGRHKEVCLVVEWLQWGEGGMRGASWQGCMELKPKQGEGWCGGGVE